MARLLLLSAFVVSTCGLVYELVTGALASYLLGDSVTQFSTVIGVYLFAMGIGSYLSRFINRNFTAVFIQVEILVGLVGGCSAALLFALFEHVASFRILMYSLVLVTGTLVGLEIPLLMRILKDRLEFKDLVSQVLTFDYVGALFASLVFPLVLVPHLGLVRSCFLFGILNVVVALATLHVFRRQVRSVQPLRAGAVAALVVLVFGFVYSERVMAYSEASLYPGQVIFAKTSRYQRIVLTRQADDVRLFLNSHLQFSSRDEYRYHEALIQPGLHATASRRRVLVLGGGDGMAVREILKHRDVESVTLVDLDPEMTVLFSRNELLTRLNGDAFHDPRVKVVNQDALVWLRDERREKDVKFDFIVLDFPDPANYSIGKLYTQTFFKMLRDAVADDGVIVIQSTSPLAARKSYWCVEHTLASVGLRTTPYHVYVPSFGEWGFVLGTKKPLREPTRFIDGLRFVSRETWPGMLAFPPDMAKVDTEVNQLNNQILVRYYDGEWSEFAPQ